MSSKSGVQFTVYNHEAGVNIFKILFLLKELGLTYEYVFLYMVHAHVLTWL